MQIGDIIRKKVKFRGFTIAEILIAMVVLGLLGALTVPMLGQQKYKKLRFAKAKHGTFECYYDENGTLHSFYSDNTPGSEDREDKDLSADGTACEFEAPLNVNYFMITAIGAGGNGGGYDPSSPDTITFEPSYSSSTIPDNGSVYIDDRFRSSLLAAPSWVRDYWERQWRLEYYNENNVDGYEHVFPKYTIKSPIGRSGTGYCIGVYNSDKSYVDPATGKGCDELLECATLSSDCPKECFNHKGGKGGHSGQQREASFYKKLRYNDNVVFDKDTDFNSYGYAAISFNPDQYVKLTKAGDGGDALRNGSDVVDGTNGADATVEIKGINELPVAKSTSPFSINYNNGFSSELIGNAQEGGAGCVTPDYPEINSGKSRIIGECSVYPEKILYYYDKLAVKATFGESGGRGEVRSMAYERLPASHLVLKPARVGTGNTQVLVVDSAGAPECIVEALSGRPGEKYENKDVPIDIMRDGAGNPILDEANNEQPIFPYPFMSEYYPKKLDLQMPNLEKFTVSGYHSKLSAILEDQGSSNYPGIGGRGTFPVVKKFEASTTSGKYIINGIRVGSTRLNNITEPTAEQINATPNCLDGTPIDASVTYCKPSAGTNGAIKISW